MVESNRESLSAFRRALARTFDSVQFRPLSFLVFFGSAGLLTLLLSTQVEQFRAKAVAQGSTIEHPALVFSVVSSVFVAPGDFVEAGVPLVELSSHFIDRELAQLDAEIEQLRHKSDLAQSRLLVAEERWLDPRLRLRPEMPSLEGPTQDFYAAQLESVRTRRAQLQEDLTRLVIKSHTAGRVSLVAPPGASVPAGSSVATLVPEFADEIVAYVPAETNPASVAAGVQVRIARPTSACAEFGTVLRRGAAVQQAPGQLANFFRFPLHGMPVYISVPESCQLGVGQVLSVEFTKAQS